MTTFDPVQYSYIDLTFLKANLGLPPAQVLRALPPGVNPNAVRPLLLRVQELEQLGEPWAGIDAIKRAIEVWEAVSTKWAADRRRGAPRFPSMASYDSRGRAHMQGPGSDSGQVRTYFAKDGSRVPFAIELSGDVAVQWKPDWVTAEELTKGPNGGLVVDADKNRIECGVCGHTEQFKPESRSAFNAARGRMSKHLRSATSEVESHRELHTHEFGQGAAR